MRTGARTDPTGIGRLVPLLTVLVTLPLHAAPSGEMDVAPFGQTRHRGNEVVVEWTDPRDLVRVEADFGEGVELPDPETVRLEYWQSRWPLERVPRGGPSGSGLAGWLHVGDPFQGEWKEADTRRRVSDATLVFTFNPVDAREFPELADDPTLSLGQRFDARYRTTYKIRLRSDEALDRQFTLRAFTGSAWVETDLEVLWGEPEEGARDLSGSVETFNGFVRAVSTVDDRSRARSVSATEWRFSVRDRTEGIRLGLSYAEPPIVPSSDDTVVTVRSRRSPFSFRPRDVPDSGSLFVPDLGVLVRRAGSGVTYAEAHAAWLERRRGNADLYTRVRERPEATLGAALAAMPSKEPHETVLGFEGSRQHVKLDERGRLELSRRWQDYLEGRDSPRCRWRDTVLSFDFGLDSPRAAGHVVDGDLPIMVGEWVRGGTRFRQTAFVVPLAGVPERPRGLAPDDTMVVMMRIEMLPREGGGSSEDGLRIRTTSGREQETLRLVDDLIVTPENETFPAGVRLRLRAARGRGALEIREDAGAIRVDAARTASGTPALDLAVPFVTLLPDDDAEDLQRLRALDFDDELAAVRAYWRGRIASSAHLETPEPELNDFHRALTPHLLINTERSILDPSHAVPKVGTIEYGVYGNESIMMITELDRRGFHDLAEQALEPWLHHQGSVGLPGTYRSHDGVLYGAGGYEAGGYNQHHGFILWGLVEHYRYSGRREWLERVVPHLLEGADWIVREIDAHARDVRGDPVRGIEAGLLPPGALEDVGDWRVWLATNAYSFRGLEAVAGALRELGHRRAGHYARRAERYRSAIRSAFEEARVRAPVVPLRDGSWIPQVPAALHRRGRSYGWISQVLEGPLHLVCAGVIAPEDRVATWILQDYEDNLFLSPSFGYVLTGAELDRSWFELGGISQQANLLCTPDAYLARGETGHFLRATFNAFAASWFPDTRMMTEHALPDLGGWVGDHFKTSDESRAAFHLRRMFAREQGATLEIGAALPRAWMEDGNEPALERAQTYFGELSVRYRSSVSDGRIEATIRTPSRRRPDAVRVHFRHPDGLPVARVRVDGREHADFDGARGVVVIDGAPGRSTRVEAFYEPDPSASGMR